MTIDENYREKWDQSHFVRRAGLTLTEFFATNKKTDPYAHASNLQRSAGLFEYQFDDMTKSSIGKPSFENRCLLLSAPRELPFLLAYDFDLLWDNGPDELESNEYAAEKTLHIQQSWDLDARVGFYIPKRSAEEGILILNSFKWDWPTIYASIFNYVTKQKIDKAGGEIIDILLTDVNSFQNVDRNEKSFHAADYEIPDERKLMASRQAASSSRSRKLAAILERKFDWGTDL